MRYDVTIGIPVYMSEAYLHKTLESALSQTYSSIEFLIIDDGSSDGNEGYASTWFRYSRHHAF